MPHHNIWQTIQSKIRGSQNERNCSHFVVVPFLAYGCQVLLRRLCLQLHLSPKNFYINVIIRSWVCSKRHECYICTFSHTQCIFHSMLICLLYSRPNRVDRKQSRENTFQYPVYFPFSANTRFNIYFLYNMHFFRDGFFQLVIRYIASTCIRRE